MSTNEEDQLYLGLSDQFSERYSINLVDLTKTERLLRALNNKTRQKILAYIDHCKRLTVTHVSESLGFEQSVTSQNLAILRKAGLIIGEKKGRHVLYRINYRLMNKISQRLKALLG